ncbi:alpha/beta fold hydrolase [Sciscionella sediminilitoris]|uniref:alpha/beta fold hydrolase n=1 Tax=Sciscionella sediminilitoris TaxID=1445613 RepID=UPI0004DF89BA|nr:alpha/beta hydrolase [Sciscionella sp. SE31]
MGTFVLIPGAGYAASCWDPLAAELRDRGHTAVAVELPSADESCGLAEYAEAVVRAAAGYPDPVLVAHSFSGFFAPLACARLRVRSLILLAAMVPVTGERPRQWWVNTGQVAAQRATGFDHEDPEELFYHGFAPELRAKARECERAQAGTPFDQPWPLEGWPDVPTRFVLFREDRLFPAAFMRRLGRERLGLTAEELPGGHLAVLSHATELAAHILGE